MSTKPFKGKAIYNPSGKAGEYSKWACNFYVGCSNGCTYCYCKKGILAGTIGKDKPQLKKCFRDEDHALNYFTKELIINLDELREHGLLFSFTTDPMLPETIRLTFMAIRICTDYDVPFYLLTKRADWFYDPLINAFLFQTDNELKKHLWHIGFTLTGYDELEPGASTNCLRVRAMKNLHEGGFKIWASIEPIIDFLNAKNVIKASLDFCDLYKVGLMSGKKYDIVEAQTFVEWLNELQKPKIYLKESLQKLSKYTNDELDDFFVNPDFKLHKL